MTTPKIFERKIIVINKPSGSKQYMVTLPKEYAQNLEDKGINSLLVIFNYGLAAFPKIGPKTEEALLVFFKRHRDFKEFFVGES